MPDGEKEMVRYSGDISLDHADGYYRSGETAKCRVLLRRDGRPLAGMKARLLLKWNGQLAETREFATTGEPVEFTYTGDRPGWAYFGFELLGEDGEPLSGEGVFKHHMKPTIVTEIGTMFDPDKIVSCVREPADFDEFWAKRRAEVLAMLPLRSELKELDSKTPGVKLFSVFLHCPRGIVASGYFAHPENAAPKSLKAGLFFQSLTFTDALRPRAIRMAECGLLGFSASWHGFPVAKPLNFYPDAIRPYYQRGMAGLLGVADREKWVNSDMFFRVMCELEFMKSRPEWNGRDLVVSGGSLGGIQTIFAAAIDPAVTLALVAVPSFCECNAFEAGRTPNGVFRRIPIDELKKHPEYLETGFYYDSVNFAKRIKCETFVCTGFTDEACHPCNVYAFYNAIPPTVHKTITTNPRTGHYNTTKDPNAAARMAEFGGAITISRQPDDAR